jgi:hypothetical protein
LLEVLTVTELTCLVCDRPVTELERQAAYRPASFEDVCVCPRCLAGEREGYGANADSVRVQLNRRRAS